VVNLATYARWLGVARTKPTGPRQIDCTTAACDTSQFALRWLHQPTAAGERPESAELSSTGLAEQRDPAEVAPTGVSSVEDDVTEPPSPAPYPSRRLYMALYGRLWIFPIRSPRGCDPTVRQTTLMFVARSRS
jgi:hypothetical protein